MVAQLPVNLALRDALLAAGLGFCLGLCYRILRLLTGSSAASCFVCDVLTFGIGAVVYRAAAAGLFAGGQMRWYTISALLAAYAAVQMNFFSIFFRLGRSIHFVVAKPFSLVFHHIWCPMRKKMRESRERRRAARAARQKQVPKSAEKDLQSNQRVLYNSN